MAQLHRPQSRPKLCVGGQRPRRPLPAHCRAGGRGKDRRAVGRLLLLTLLLVLLLLFRGGVPVEGRRGGRCCARCRPVARGPVARLAAGLWVCPGGVEQLVAQRAQHDVGPLGHEEDLPLQCTPWVEPPIKTRV